MIPDVECSLSSTASVPTSYYSTWHYNYLCSGLNRPRIKIP